MLRTLLALPRERRREYRVCLHVMGACRSTSPASRMRIAHRPNQAGRPKYPQRRDAVAGFHNLRQSVAVDKSKRPVRYEPAASCPRALPSADIFTLVPTTRSQAKRVRVFPVRRMCHTSTALGPSRLFRLDSPPCKPRRVLYGNPRSP